MEKPTTKARLLNDIKAEHERLEAVLRTLSDTEMLWSEAPGAWSAKDILAHIIHWEKYFLQRYEAGARGEKQFLPDGSKPGVLDAINLGVYKANQNRELGDVKKEYKASYRRTLKIIQTIPEEAMFAHDKYEWTGKYALADYIAGNTSEHYAEHILMIEELKRKMGK